MAVTVNEEVLEGLRSLQQKVEEAEKSLAFYQAQVLSSQEVVERETARLADLVRKLDAAKTRLGIQVEEVLVFKEADLAVLTKTESDTIEAAAAAALKL